MTISSETSKVIYIGNDVASVFAYTFKIFKNTDIVVTEVLISTGAETVLTLTTDYTVSGVGVAGGGNVTLVAGALPSTKKLVIQLDPELLQETDYREHGPYPAEVLESSLDKSVNISKSLKEILNRLVVRPITETTPLTIPALVNGKFLSNDGNDLLWATLTSITYNGTMTAGVDASKAAVPGVNDIYVATDTKRIYVCFSIGVWSVINHFYGLDANKAAAPLVGEVYIATDTKRIYACYVAGTWSVTNHFYGLDANKAVTPIVGEMFFATDTKKRYFCFVAGAWVQLIDEISNQTIAGIKTFSGANIHNGINTFNEEIISGATLDSPPVVNALYKENILNGWIKFDGTGAISITNSFNVSGIIDNGVGDYEISWDTDFANANYVTVGNADAALFVDFQGVQAVGSTPIRVIDTGAVNRDSDRIFCIAIGDQ